MQLGEEQDEKMGEALEGGQSRRAQVPGRGEQRDEAPGHKERPPETGPWESRAGEQKQNLTRGSQEAPTQERTPQKAARGA